MSSVAGYWVTHLPGLPQPHARDSGVRESVAAAVPGTSLSPSAGHLPRPHPMPAICSPSAAPHAGHPPRHRAGCLHSSTPVPLRPCTSSVHPPSSEPVGQAQQENRERYMTNRGCDGTFIHLISRQPRAVHRFRSAPISGWSSAPLQAAQRPDRKLVDQQERTPLEFWVFWVNWF